MSNPEEPILDQNLSPAEKELQAIRIYFEWYAEGKFYECHDVMEEIWFETAGPRRRFFQGLLQCAVARYHWSNENLHGAQILYHEGTEKLERFRPEYLGVDLETYIAELNEALPQIVTNPRPEERV